MIHNTSSKKISRAAKPHLFGRKNIFKGHHLSPPYNTIHTDRSILYSMELYKEQRRNNKEIKHPL